MYINIFSLISLNLFGFILKCHSCLTSKYQIIWHDNCLGTRSTTNYVIDFFFFFFKKNKKQDFIIAFLEI